MSVTIWLIGWAFTIGLCFEEEWQKEYIWKVPLSPVNWPVLLGQYIRENYGNYN